MPPAAVRSEPCACAVGLRRHARDDVSTCGACSRDDAWPQRSLGPHSPQSPANIDAAKEWRESREDFKKKVARIVRKSQEML